MSANANRPAMFPARQRVVVLTFATPDDADAWDDAGQPFHVGWIAPDNAAVISDGIPSDIRRIGT